jgi:N-methylhydantoinase A
MTYSKLTKRGALTGRASPESRRRAYFGRAHGFIDTPVIGRAALGDNWRSGPLIVEEYDATCIVPPRARARLDALGNIEIDVQEVLT